jgi:hypothetical protein
MAKNDCAKYVCYCAARHEGNCTKCGSLWPLASERRTKKPGRAAMTIPRPG